jgi:starch synthase
VSRPLRVLHIASECAPFAKTGGLGDVVGALPIAQRAQGIDARVVLPLYRGIDWNALEQRPYTLTVPMGGGAEFGAVRRGVLPDSEVPIYFLEHLQYFDRAGIYGDTKGDFGDSVRRFAYLCRGAFAACRAEGFSPDIVHAHDWQAALAPVYVDTTEWGTELHGAATVLTIHNLGYQGMFTADDLPATGLGWEHYNGEELEHFGALNLLKGGLTHADRITTVSPTYAREIQRPEHGNGLDGVIRSRAGRLHGILNGIDTRVWNPEIDQRIAARYSASELWGKARCKEALQREAGLPVRPDVPLFTVVTRLTGQKGMDILVSILASVLQWDVQLVVLGSGDSALERSFEVASRLRPDKIKAFLRFDDALAHRIEAGGDFFLMPSRYEPCGMNQMYSLRYGTLPIVHATGGLADTVWNYDDRTGDGTGFVMNELTPRALHDAMGRAAWAHAHRREQLDQLRRRGMGQRFGWDRAAAAYTDVYLGAYAQRRGHGFMGLPISCRQHLRRARVSSAQQDIEKEREPGGEERPHPHGRGLRRGGLASGARAPARLRMRQPRRSLPREPRQPLGRRIACAHREQQQPPPELALAPPPPPRQPQRHRLRRARQLDLQQLGQLPPTPRLDRPAPAAAVAAPPVAARAGQHPRQLQLYPRPLAQPLRWHPQPEPPIGPPGPRELVIEEHPPERGLLGRRALWRLGHGAPRYPLTPPRGQFGVWRPPWPSSTSPRSERNTPPSSAPAGCS